VSTNDLKRSKKIDDLKRFKQRVEVALARAITPIQRLTRTVLLIVVNNELRELEAGGDAEADRQSQPEQHEGENGQ